MKNRPGWLSSKTVVTFRFVAVLRFISRRRVHDDVRPSAGSADLLVVNETLASIPREYTMPLAHWQYWLMAAERMRLAGGIPLPHVNPWPLRAVRAVRSSLAEAKVGAPVKT